MRLGAPAVWLLAAPVAAADTARLAIYHTNDVHGWIHPKAATWHAPNPKRLIGGFPAAANVLKRERLPRLLLDGGDWFQGTPEAAFSNGKAAIDGFNALRYDAVVIGNHDFDYGQAQLEKLVEDMEMPVLGSNIYRERDGRRPAYITPHLIKEVAGIKIGIFGLTTRNMKDLSFEENYAGLTFRREADEAREMVRKLRAKGAKLIIAVTHVGFIETGMAAFEDDKFIAGEVPGIDVIVGGHTHTRLKAAVREPRHGTIIGQTGSYLSQLGRIELEVERKTGKIVDFSSGLIDLWVDEVGEDERVKKLLTPYKEEADRQLSVVIATATATLTRNRNGEATIGAWFTDCVRDWSGTDVAVQNHGGIRADLPAGPVSLRRIFEIMPFDNRVATLTLTGAQLRETLEHGVSGAAGMLQISGLTVRYNPSAEPGRRVREVRVGSRLLENGERYSVAAADFLVKRGDGYAALGRGEETTFTSMLLRDVLASCAKKAGTISPPASGRLTAEN
jgi:5'-nucleotidase / UDP-sugar diphosphatase